MPIEVTFAEYQKRVFQKYTPSEPNSHVKGIEVNTQNVATAAGTFKSASTRLVYNCGFPLSDALRARLTPVSATWLPQATVANMGMPVDAAFGADLPTSLEEFHFGKSMQRWIAQVPGFGPCLSFNANLRAGSPISTVIETELSPLRLRIAERDFRIVSRGVGYFYGPKGVVKKAQRESGAAIPFSDPLAPATLEGFANEINLDFKFALALSAADGVSASMPVQFFHHGEYPQLASSFNVHLRSPKDGEVGIATWAELEAAMVGELSRFKSFLCDCTTIRKLIEPKDITSFSGWTLVPERTRSYTPTQAAFVTQQIAVDDPFTASQIFAGLPVVSATYPKPIVKVPAASARAVSTPSRKPGNSFAVFQSDSSEGDSSSDSELST